jgi:hypothetical protein
LREGRESEQDAKVLCQRSVRRQNESENPYFTADREVVPATGLEPVQCYLLEPESSASANSATRAKFTPTNAANGIFVADVLHHSRGCRLNASAQFERGTSWHRHRVVEQAFGLRVSGQAFSLPGGGMPAPNLKGWADGRKPKACSTTKWWWCQDALIRAGASGGCRPPIVAAPKCFWPRSGPYASFQP